MTAMTAYSNEQRLEIMARAREAIESAEATLNAPRPEIEPPVETRAQKWKREADEQAARFAAERAKSDPLTEWEAAQLEHRLAGLVGEQKELVLQIVAGCIAELRHEFAERIERLTAELEQVRADLTIAKFNNSNNSGDVVELPTLPLRRRA